MGKLIKKNDSLPSIPSRHPDVGAADGYKYLDKERMKISKY